MKNLSKNIAVFTTALLIITLLVEFFRKGKIQMEDPGFFIIAILFLGFAGGYIYTWVYEEKNN